MNYLELVGIMGVDPAGWVEKIDDLRIIFVNMHHLLNEYRPHQVVLHLIWLIQARETLCMMMEAEIERTKEEIRGIEEACDKVEQVLDKVTKGLEDANAIDGSVSDGNHGKGDGEQMEDVVHEMKGKDRVPEKPDQKWFEYEKLMDLWKGPV